MVDMDVRDIVDRGVRLAGRAGEDAHFLAKFARAGLVRPELPHRLAQIALAYRRRGLLAGAITISAIRYGDRVALRDELGAVTYRELDERSDALAAGWLARGLAPGDGVAILARNHRGFLYAVFAAAKCGARVILLNTSFAGPQIREVAAREGTDLLVHDDEYAAMLEGLHPARGRWRSWVDDPEQAEDPDTLEALIAACDPGDAPTAPGVEPKLVILTSGTTGTPKGAPRGEPRSLSLIGGLLDKVPFRAGETTELCAPMFHSLGFALLILGLSLGSTLIVRRHFEPSVTLDSLERHRASAMVVVPVMLRRMLDLGEEELARRDLSALRIVFVSGSQLSVPLATRAARALGPVVYNLYGSTEVAYAAIATPADLARAPGSVGGVVRGAVVKILDGAGDELPAGVTGRIFVGNGAQFEGYTGGDDKERIGGLMSSGDVGHFDERGLLYIDGRDDEMIVSGGENVFPGEVEELLAAHEAIEEVAAIGVEDETFGQRLKAFVVVRSGRRLTEEEVKEYVRQNLARYKIPREVVFVPALPRNPTGKVLKRELKQI
jgi:fatty-acyl-CoA synthase